MRVRVVSLDGEIEEVQTASGDLVVLSEPRPGREEVLLTTDGAAPTGATHWVSDGELVAYTAAEAAAKSQRPTHAARWDNATMAWLDLRPPVDAEVQARDVRDSLLAACDWVVTMALERGEPVPAKWVAYRQGLRDAPSLEGWPHTHTLPDPPT